MNKKNRHFEKVTEYKERFRHLSLEQLRKKQVSGYPLIKEAAVAVRELIQELEHCECGGNSDNTFLDSVSRGISDAENGRTHSTEAIRAALATKRSNV